MKLGIVLGILVFAGLIFSQGSAPYCFGNTLGDGLYHIPMSWVSGHGSVIMQTSLGNNLNMLNESTRNSLISSDVIIALIGFVFSLLGIYIYTKKKKYKIIGIILIIIGILAILAGIAQFIILYLMKSIMGSII